MDLMDLSKVTFSLRRDGQSQRYFGNKNWPICFKSTLSMLKDIE